MGIEFTSENRECVMPKKEEKSEKVKGRERKKKKWQKPGRRAQKAAK